MSNLQASQVFYTSLVIEHIVPWGKDFAFRRWRSSLIQEAKRYEGFVRSDFCPPLKCKDGVVKWYTILHFDTPAHLHSWIESDDRKYLLEAGQKIFNAYRFKSFTTGLEGWFSAQAGTAEQVGLGPPAWKQILSVVVGLYPIVMLQSLLFTAFGVMQSWSPATQMLANNLMSSTLLTLVVMPFVARSLRFWLQPAYRIPAIKQEILGLVIVITLLATMATLFHHFSY